MRKANKTKVAEIIQLSKEGMSPTAIAKQLNVATSYVYTTRYKHGIKGVSKTSQPKQPVNHGLPDHKTTIDSLKTEVNELSKKLVSTQSSLEIANKFAETQKEKVATLHQDLLRAQIAWHRAQGVISYLEERMVEYVEENDNAE